MTGEKRYFMQHPLLGLLVFAVAAIVVWFLGRFINRKPLDVMELDQHGRKLVPKARLALAFWLAAIVVRAPRVEMFSLKTSF
jgi:hypothetical protein